MYIKRVIEERLIYLSKHFPVVLVCGARQIGKTTMLRKFNEQGGEKCNYVTLDYPRMRTLAKTDPELFLQENPAPLIIDEIQYAPELLTYIKIRVDNDGSSGQYFLTGSQMFHMMKNVGESLAGRVGILTMYPLSRAEIDGRTSRPFLPGNKRDVVKRSDAVEIFDMILRGSMPKMAVDKELSSEDFYGAYMQTYLERDIRDFAEVRDETRFLRFISCAAARTAQELNLSDIGKDVGIDRNTAESWLNILISTGLVYILPPYSGNTIKRIVKRPKLYFMDTGLACYLSFWNNAQALELSAMSGAMFETYVISEIIKSYANSGRDTRSRLYYYRDNNGKEIDLIIAENGMLHPVEIKKSADPGNEALKNFNVIDAIGGKRGKGAVVCMTPSRIPLDADNELIPVWEI